MGINYYNKKVECASREELDSIQLEGLKRAVELALNSDYYGKKLPESGITSSDDIKSLDDLKRLPFTKKNDLRDSYPYGFLAVDRSDVVRMHASSGTTGTPTTIYLTAEDLDRSTEILCRSLAGTGASSEDVFQNMMTYGLFTGGIMLHYGAEKLGMMVIPVSSGNTARQFKMMKDFQTTAIHATPSYMLYLYSKMEELGIKRSDLALKRGYVGAEPHSEDVRKKIENLWDIDIYNCYGLSEMNGPGLAFECSYKDGLHVWEDSYIPEIINPDTLEPVKEGEYGELVLTILHRDAMPILRYRTRDLTRFIPGKCRCGRLHRRIDRIKGRSDDMLIINGVNVFPSQIEEVIMRMPEVGTNYLIIAQKSGPLDKLIVKTEVTKDVITDDTRDLYSLKARIAENLKTSIFINPVVELHEQGSLPVSEGKAKRVIDERNE
ncbi:MAG: phenylacetate--CoA ligase [Spirochaetales bacterium]|nr:phenylacetate--CoA ligase [Spirochaetales bacterium]